MKKGSKVLNLLLLLSFVLTILVPLTGIHIHKLASVLFLLLCMVHTIVYRKKLGAKRYGLLGLIFVSFASGIFGMIVEEYPLILQIHRAISIAAVFFMAIHIFVYHKKMAVL